MIARLLTFMFILWCPVLFTACSGVYYSTMEKIGYEKREILADRVESARDAQQEAKEQFASALDRFRSVVRFEGGELEEKYEILNREYEWSEDKAEKVRDRIEAVEDVAEALFKEWKQEIGEYTSAKLRRSSEEQLTRTRSRYDRLIKAMWKAESKIPPVLSAFKDQVLFLKHNLNARAIASLEGELGSIQNEVGALIKEMEASIAEADAFISTLESK